MINLTLGQLLLQPSAELCSECQSLESRFAEEYLRSSDPYSDTSILLGVLGLVGRQSLERLIPLIQKCWRSKKYKATCTTGSHVLRGQQRTTLEPLPTMSLVLAASESLEPGPACYSLHPGWGRENPKHLAVRRERCARLAQLQPEMDVSKVLQSTGCPDFINSFTEQREGTHRWGEQWDYYTQEPFEVVRILWEPDSYGTKMRSLQRLTFSPADVEERLSLLLGD